MEVRVREGWGTKLGFILAAIGSAVGLGNMWRFPYATAERGGAAFVILYVLMVFLIGVPVMLSEFAVGRRARLSPIGALRQVGGRGWGLLGYVYVATGCLILAYYSVIAGWTLRYTLEAALGGFSGSPAAYFQSSSTGVGALLYHLLFMGITISIVVSGVKRGIERASLVLMPLLFALVAGLAIWAAFQPGAGPGYGFYLRPAPGKLLSAETLSAAAGQAFFSLSLGMGAMLTYASYLGRDENLPGSAVTISASDFAVAFLAGLVVFPVIFAFGLQADIGESTVGALFISLPTAFVKMGAAGRIVGFLFFVALFVGALTSGISLLEVVTSSLIDTWKLDRAGAALGAGLVITLLGVPSAFSLDVLGLFDKVAGEFLLVVGGLALALFVGWRMADPLGEVRRGFKAEGLLRAWLWMVRVVVPIILTVVVYQVAKSMIELIGATLF
jgi:NSS family neurotransmitter:Na+ symporter